MLQLLKSHFSKPTPTLSSTAETYFSHLSQDLHFQFACRVLPRRLNKSRTFAELATT